MITAGGNCSFIIIVPSLKQNPTSCQIFRCFVVLCFLQLLHPEQLLFLMQAVPVTDYTLLILYALVLGIDCFKRVCSITKNLVHQIAIGWKKCLTLRICLTGGDILTPCITIKHII